MNLCSICSINGKEKTLYEVFSFDKSINKMLCAWCRAPLEKNLKSTFNMVFIKPQSDTGFNYTANLEPMCDSCQSHHSTKVDDPIPPKRFIDYNVNTKIAWKWCNENLTCQQTDSSVYIDIAYDSTLSIERKKSVVRKLFDCCCLNCS